MVHNTVNNKLPLSLMAFLFESTFTLILAFSVVFTMAQCFFDEQTWLALAMKMTSCS